MDKKDIINNYLYKLSKSKFRSSFNLNKKMKEYCKNNGYRKIKNDTKEIISKRIKPAIIENDGKQTPTRQVHPVFIAQHATATCCRGCLEKWYKIPKGKELEENEINFITELIIGWITNQINNE